MTGYSIYRFQKGEPCLIVLESHEHFFPNVWKGKIFSFWERHYYRIAVIVTDEAVRDNPDPEINQYYNELAPGNYFVHRADSMLSKSRACQLERYESSNQHEDFQRSRGIFKMHGFASDDFKASLQIGNACWIELTTSHQMAPNMVRGRVVEQKELDGMLLVRAVVTDKRIGKNKNPRINSLYENEPTVFYEVTPMWGFNFLTIVQFFDSIVESVTNYINRKERIIRQMRIKVSDKIP